MYVFFSGIKEKNFFLHYEVLHIVIFLLSVGL